MGLDISGCCSDKDYHWSYSGIHQVRALSIMALGLDEKITPEMIRTKRMEYSFLHDKTDDEMRWGLIQDLMYGDSKYQFGSNREKGNGTPPGVTFEDLEKHWQLHHFSDCGGLLIRDGYLENVDYSESFYLGNSNRLLDALEDIKEFIARNPEKVKDLKRALEIFWMLYDLVEDEVNNGCGTLRFS